MPATAQDASSSRPGARAWLRALLISVVLLVQCTAATPHTALNRERLSRSEGQRAIAALERGFGLLGARLGPDAIAGMLIDASQRLLALRNAMLAPVQPFFQHTATHQQWRLFLTPTRECYRIHVEAREASGRWLHLYSALGQDRVGLSPALRYRRLRGMYNPSVKRGPGPQYHGFVRWLSRRLLAARPEYRALRVRMERLRIGAPGEPLRTLGYEHVVTRGREALVL